MCRTVTVMMVSGILVIPSQLEILLTGQTCFEALQVGQYVTDYGTLSLAC